MAALERFLHDPQPPYPALLNAALAHVQFETIHPFLDGNGRIGRLLIAFILHHQGVLSQPLLYLSLYFKQHRQEYYRLLDQVRFAGDWEAWVDFFLEGVERTATNAVDTAKLLFALFQEDEQRIKAIGRGAAAALCVFQVLRRRPLVNLSQVCAQAHLSFPGAAKGMEVLMRLGIARELTGQRRNRVFTYDRYLAILQEGTEPL